MFLSARRPSSLRSFLQGRSRQLPVAVAQRAATGIGPVSEALPGLDTGNFGDQNGDGLGCHKVNKGQTAVHVHDVGFDLWTWKDNTN